MQDFSSRFTILSDAYAAGLGWLAGDGPSAQAPNSTPGLDLGNGVELSAPDVVDSHFDRLVNGESLSTPHEPTVRPPERPDSNIENGLPPGQTDGGHATESLNRAIGSLAPELLPLVHVAEQVSEATPPVSASKEFRTLLNDALVAEQKQQINKQAIGIQPSEVEDDLLEKISENKSALLLGLSLALSLALVLWYLCRPRHKK